MHSPQDNVAHLNVDYWLEQIKATVAVAARLAGPVRPKLLYLPTLLGTAENTGLSFVVVKSQFVSVIHT